MASTVDNYISNEDRSNKSAEDYIKNGLKLKSGIECEQNLEEAVQSFKQAAEMGSAEAMRYLGISYTYGAGVPQDNASATNWYRKAADRGDADAMYRLFRNLSTGTGCAVDIAEADKWLKRASDKGFAEAVSTYNRFQQSGKLYKDLEEPAVELQDGKRAKSINLEKVSPSSKLAVQETSDSGSIFVESQSWEKIVTQRSASLMIIVYAFAGGILGALLKSVYEKNIYVMGSYNLISNFSTAQGFATFMAVIGALLGLGIGILFSKLISKVHETILLYIPILFLPLIIMGSSSLIMGVVNGVVGLAVTIAQIAAYVVAGYSLLGSSSNR